MAGVEQKYWNRGGGTPIALALVLLISFGCVNNPPSDASSSGADDAIPESSPLALVAPIKSGNLTEAGQGAYKGKIDITSDCVVWVGQDSKESTLIWRQGEATYDKATNSITFWSDNWPEGVTLEDGTKVDFAVAATTGSSDFVIPPKNGCPDNLLLVLEVERLSLVDN